VSCLRKRRKAPDCNVPATEALLARGRSPPCQIVLTPVPASIAGKFPPSPKSFEDSTTPALRFGRDLLPFSEGNFYVTPLRLTLTPC